MHRLHRPPPHGEATFQITPMIDMVFLLLVFFMVTSRITNDIQHKQVTLPIARAAHVDEKPVGRTVISIDNQGTYYLGEQPMTLKQLKQHLRQKRKASQIDSLVIRADKNTESKYVKSLIRKAGEVGIGEIIFATQRR